MADKINIGDKVGKWLVLDGSRGTRHSRCFCVCECGSFQRVQTQHLKKGLTNGCLSCGIVKHGMTYSGTAGSWKAMIGRCRNPKNPKFSQYGGRGIKVCQEWLEFKKFFEDMGPRPDGMSLERKDSNKDYEPENCIWADIFKQNNNRSCNRRVIYDGKEYTVAELSRYLGVGYSSLLKRLNKGMLDVFELPSRRDGGNA